MTNETQNSILSYRDPRVRQTTICGTAIAIVAPPIGAMGKILGTLPDHIQDDIKSGNIKQADFARIMEVIPDLCIYCVRESANPKQHVFQDTPEVRAQLLDLPFEDAINVMTITFELMGANKDAVEKEIKN